MNDWQYAGAWAFVIAGGTFILVASAFGHPVDGSAITAYGLVSAYVLNQQRIRRQEKRDDDHDDEIRRNGKKDDVDV